MINKEIYDHNSKFTNGYYGSKYNHWKYSQFSHIDLVKPKKINKNFLSSINRKIINKDLLLTELINYYYDLNKILKRVLNNVVDLMFFRFAYKTVMFKYPETFGAVCNCWDEVFNDACHTYILTKHDEFDETFGISYVAYFEIHFSLILFQTFISYDYIYNLTRTSYNDTYLQNNMYRNIEIYRLSWLHENDLQDPFMDYCMNYYLQSQGVQYQLF